MIDPIVARRAGDGPARDRLIIRQVGPGTRPLAHYEADTWSLIELYVRADMLSALAHESQADATVLDAEPTRRKLATVKWLYLNTRLLDGCETVAILDDDVEARGAVTWDRIFDLFEKTGASVGQPALAPGSYVTHDVTRQVPGLKWRVTDFAEVMCPIFARAALERTVHLFDVTESGWSVDDAYMAVEREAVILDATPVAHTRPLGTTYSTAKARAESQAWLRASGTPMTRKVTLRHGPRVDGVPVDVCWVCMTRRAAIFASTVGICRPCVSQVAAGAIQIGRG
jgi:hypothetical protein